MAATDTAMTRDQIAAEIRRITSTGYAVASNAGTYGPHEAVAKVGTADPAFADRRTLVFVDGTTVHEGPSADRAPGRMRHLGYAQVQAARARLAELRRMLDALPPVDHAAVAVAEKNQDANVAAVACAAWGVQVPVRIDYYGTLARVRQTGGGRPLTCTVDTTTMTVR